MSKTIKLGILVIILLGGLFLFKNAKQWFAGSFQRAAAPCVNRLRAINSAKELWALQNSKKAGEQVKWDDIRIYLPDSWTNSSDWTNGMPVCLEGGSYILGRIGEAPTCSIGGSRHTLPR